MNEPVVSIDLSASPDYEQAHYVEWMLWEWQRHSRRWRELPWSMRLLTRLHILRWEGPPSFEFNYTYRPEPFLGGDDDE